MLLTKINQRRLLPRHLQQLVRKQQWIGNVLIFVSEAIFERNYKKVVPLLPAQIER